MRRGRQVTLLINTQGFAFDTAQTLGKQGAICVTSQ
jgi:hypothetical protein